MRIDHSFAERDYVAHVDFPDDLSQEDVIAAMKKAGGPMSLEQTLPAALAEVTGRKYRVVDHPEKWVRDGEVIREVTLTVEPA